MTVDEIWLRATVVVAGMGDDELEAASALLWSAGAAGVELRDDNTMAKSGSTGHAEAVAFFGGVAPEMLRSDLLQRLTQIGLSATVAVEPFTDTSWKETWKQFFLPTQVSPRIAVAPPWDVPARPDHVVTIVVDPGLAFGTGTHATTQLCLAVLDEQLANEPPATMLDVGCGSGILSIAAAMLCPTCHIVAVDVDPEALRVTEENIALNDVALLIEVGGQRIDDRRADLVVANILSHILLHLRSELVQAVEPGGTLVLSGIGDDDVASVKSGFEEHDIHFRQHHNRDGWNVLVGRKP